MKLSTIEHITHCKGFAGSGFVQAFLAWVKLNLDPKKYNINGDPEWEPST